MKARAAAIIALLLPSAVSAMNFPPCTPDPASASDPATALPTLGYFAWSLGGVPVFESPGGLSFGAPRTPPQFAFASAEEFIVGATLVPGQTGQVLAFTRAARGFSAYLVDVGASTLTHLLSQKLDEQFPGRAITSPLVDVGFDGTSITLLTNFNLLRLTVADVLAGRFTPLASPLTNQNLTQDASALLRGAALVRTRYTPGLTALLFPFAYSYPELWGSIDASPFPFSSFLDLMLPPLYVTALTNRVISDSRSHTWLGWILGDLNQTGHTRQVPEQGIYGEFSEVSTMPINDYAISASFEAAPDPAAGRGAVSFASRGTFLFSYGKPSCQVSGAPLGSLTYVGLPGGRATLQGFEWGAGVYHSITALLP